MNAEELLPVHSASASGLDRGYRVEIRRSQTAATDERLPPLAWLNLLCLDAPLVAVVWQELFARTFGVQLQWPVRAMLFLTAWVIYLADRWFDCSRLSSASPRSLRQRFWEGRLSCFGGLVIVIALADLLVSWLAIDRTLFMSGAAVGTAAVAYLIVNHTCRIWTTLPIKECCVGFLFAAGTSVALVPAAIDRRVSLASMVLSFGLFGLLCSLNCISIAIWERDLDLAQGNVSIATRWPTVGSWLNASAAVIAAGAIIAALFDQRLASVGLCVGSSAILLRLIVSLPMSPDERTALADLVLLTPLLLVI
jgi:hypothetical protein